MPARAGETARRSSSSSGSKPQLPSAKQTSSRKHGRGARTSTACEACKKRKTKCTGSTPCELCVTLGTECVIDYSLDMRRRSAMQRALGETKSYQQTLESFLEVVRDDDEDRLMEFLGFIRRQPSAQAAATALRDNLVTRRGSGSDVANGISGPPLPQSASTNIVEISSIPEGALSSPISPVEATAQLLQTFKVEWPPNDHSGHVTGDFLGDGRQLSPVSSIAMRETWHPALQLPENADFPSEHSVLRRMSIDQFPQRHIFHPPYHPHQMQDCVDIRLPSDGIARIDGIQFPRGDDLSRIRIPIYLVLPLSVVDDSIICRIYTDFLRAARHMIENGAATAELINGEDIEVDLFFRPRQSNDRFTSCSWASEVMRRFDEFDVFMRLAWVVLLCPMMRWLLAPNAETYANVPEMMRPVCGQRLIPHVAGIDICPFPVLRDALIAELRDWMSALCQANCSVNWHHSMDDTLEKDPVTGATKLSAAFRDHAVNHDNWTVNSSLLLTFPEARGHIRVIDNELDFMSI